MNLRRVATSAAALLLLTLAVPVSASAQMVISAGAKGGLNIANVSFNLSGLTVSPKSRAGLVIGGFVAVDRKQAGLVIEGLFSQHGTTLEFTQGSDTDKQQIRLDYIVFPVLGRVNLKAANGVTVHLYAGPQFGFRTGYENKDTLTVDGITTETTDHDDSGIRGHNIDIAFGGQVDFRMFLVDLRYALGLTDLNSDTGPEEPDVKNRTFSIMFGVKLK
jgi:hypothetical protein